MTAQLSTVSSWSLGALPLPTVPRPQVFQYRENVDHHDVLCVCVCNSVSLVSPGLLHTHQRFLHCVPYGRIPARPSGCVQISGNHGLQMATRETSAICFLEWDSETELSV